MTGNIIFSTDNDWLISSSKHFPVVHMLLYGVPIASYIKNMKLYIYVYTEIHNYYKKIFMNT